MPEWIKQIGGESEMSEEERRRIEYYKKYKAEGGEDELEEEEA